MSLQKRYKTPTRLSPIDIKLTDTISYKNINLLKTFLTEQGKILPQKLTQLTLKQQRKLKKSVKRARILSFLSFVKSV